MCVCVSLVSLPLNPLVVQLLYLHRHGPNSLLKTIHLHVHLAHLGVGVIVCYGMMLVW